MHAEPLHRALDRCEHLRHRVALLRGELGDVLALIAVLRHRLTAPQRVDRRAEALHLSTRVVVVVLARDVVAAERQQPRDAVAVRAVARRGHDDRAGRVRRDHLDLNPLRARRPAPAVAVADLGERLEEERVRKPQVDEARPRHLGRGDLVELGEPARELLCELARRPAGRLRRAERDIGREVAVRGVLRPLQLDHAAGDLADLRREALDDRFRRQGLRLHGSSIVKRHGRRHRPAAQHPHGAAAPRRRLRELREHHLLRLRVHDDVRADRPRGRGRRRPGRRRRTGQHVAAVRARAPRGAAGRVLEVQRRSRGSSRSPRPSARPTTRS